jgi:hypothetical protein
MRLRPVTLVVTAGAALSLLVGCSSAEVEVSPVTPAAEESQASDSSTFCTDYSDVGGTLATPSNFQIGLPAEQTIADLSERIAVFDAVTAPDEIATEWQTTRDLYAESVEIAEQTTPSEPVMDSRVIEIIGELDEPTGVIRDYLDAEC